MRHASVIGDPSIIPALARPLPDHRGDPAPYRRPRFAPARRHPGAARPPLAPPVLRRPGPGPVPARSRPIGPKSVSLSRLTPAGPSAVPSTSPVRSSPGWTGPPPWVAAPSPLAVSSRSA